MISSHSIALSTQFHSFPILFFVTLGFGQAPKRRCQRSSSPAEWRQWPSPFWIRWMPGRHGVPCGARHRAASSAVLCGPYRAMTGRRHVWGAVAWTCPAPRRSAPPSWSCASARSRRSSASQSCAGWGRGSDGASCPESPGVRHMHGAWGAPPGVAWAVSLSGLPRRVAAKSWSLPDSGLWTSTRGPCRGENSSRFQLELMDSA